VRCLNLELIATILAPFLSVNIGSFDAARRPMARQQRFPSPLCTPYICICSVVCCLFTGSECLTKTELKKSPTGKDIAPHNPDNVAPQIDEPKAGPGTDELTVTSRIDSGVPGV
jgi:hypothetical protein